MRTIQVSTDVYAAIWSDRKTGEESEDAILARRFSVVREHRDRDIATTVGFHDPRFGVRIESGFPIYRTFKGKEYRAQAVQGFWVLGATGKGFPTLNQLSIAIGAGKEDAWKAWFFDDKNGKRRPVSDLRDPNKIKKRARMATTLDDLV